MSVPSIKKLHGFWNKVVLRKLMVGAIPEIVRNRPDKMRFSTPDAKWIKTWSPEIETIFRRSSFRQRGFFNVPNLLKALDDHARGVNDFHREIFKALQLELWLRTL